MVCSQDLQYHIIPLSEGGYEIRLRLYPLHAKPEHGYPRGSFDNYALAKAVCIAMAKRDNCIAFGLDSHRIYPV